MTEHTELERDLLAALKRLCFDRGVLLHATCCDDTRQLYRDLLAKHDIGDDMEGCMWVAGNTIVSVKI